MNAPAAFESFLVFDGEKKIVVEKDTKVPNAAVFTVNKEDHTVGNLLKNQLLKDPQVLFAGYKCPHPLEHKFVLRVQTTSDTTPADALTSAITDLMAELSLFEERFRLQNRYLIPSISPSSTVFRVKRKRIADPHEALIISLKRSRKVLEEPIICFRASSSDLNVCLCAGHFQESPQCNIIDVDPSLSDVDVMSLDSQNGKETGRNIDDDSNSFLDLMKDAPCSTASSEQGFSQNSREAQVSKITLNGVPMNVINVDSGEDFTFDYYWSSKADGCVANEIKNVRIANREDLLMDYSELYDSDEDDDDDSNDEFNWRNDYPDEPEVDSDIDDFKDLYSDGDEFTGYLEKLHFYDSRYSEDESP
ncbi:unnamed protein product [Thelazia callipaeda]|uniref:Probable DNA-directed RNA polymerase II subunit RPB11 n=1 Tax=Thelazia callipaeda TaxID=103827 RepID=A0A0N5CPY4_THECL|nr:unnamed protein product [Thelazia callipaeda]